MRRQLETLSESRELFFGRGPELAAITRLLENASQGRSGALMIVGEPGIGKTALLDQAAASAGAFRVISARGTEFESHLPFAGLSQLLRPLLDHLEEIPPPQASALAGALALAPPVSGDRFTIYAAVLSLLGAGAADTPLLALLDDAHWLDPASAQGIVFASRRLGTEGVAVLLSAREEEGRIPHDSGLDVLRIGGLDEASARALMETRARSPVAPRVCGTIYRATGGNPLALVELAALLSPDQLAGTEPLGDPLPLGPVLEAAYQRRVEGLPGPTRRALTVAAAASLPSAQILAPALRRLGLGYELLTPAEEAGLLAIGPGEVIFSHPLVRSACYHAASPDDRRAAHLALAEGLTGDRHLAVRAWHLAAAATGTDEAAASTLEKAATAASERRAHAEAGAALQRAARLTPAAEVAARRFLAAAREFNLVGQSERATLALDDSLSASKDPFLVADVNELRAQMDMWRGLPMRSYALLVDTAERVLPLDRARAASLLAQAAFAAGNLSSAFEEALTVARRAADLAPEHPLVLSALASILITCRREAEARPLIHAIEPFIEQLDPLIGHVPLTIHSLLLTFLEDWEGAQRVARKVVGAARAGGSPGVLPLPLGVLCYINSCLGRWREAYAQGVEATRLAEDTGQASEFPLMWLSYTEALQGREEECRSHAKQCLDQAERSGNLGLLCWARASLGKLELSLGRFEQAIKEFEECFRLIPPPANPTAEWQSDAAEAYLRAGRQEEARERYEVLERWAREVEHASGLACAARGRMLIGDEEEVDRWFGEAIKWHRRTPIPFERARTELCYGERLHGGKRLTEARTHLRRALEVFERLGAERWAEWASRELRASGGAPRRTIAEALGELSPQELQVAELVAAGATNKEVAAALFLSPRTVGYHLSNVYRKLRIRSRVELAPLLTRPGTAGRAFSRGTG